MIKGVQSVIDEMITGLGEPVTHAAELSFKSVIQRVERLEAAVKTLGVELPD